MTRASWIPSRVNDPKANARSESVAEATVDTHEAGDFEENQAGEGCENRRGSGSCHNLKVTEAIAPKKRAQETR